MSTNNYYEVLGVSKTATQAEIKKAYHKLAMEHHPDRNAGKSDAEQKFKEINQAYDVLKDEQKRAAYDQLGHAAFNQTSSRGYGPQAHAGGYTDINDIFGDFFSDVMGGNRRRSSDGRVKGSDLKYNLTITLEEAFKGIDRNIAFNAEVKCDSCHGSGAEGNSTSTTCDLCRGAGVTRIQQGFFAIEQTCGKCHGAGQFIKDPCKKCHGNGRFAQTRNLLINIPAGIEDNTRMRLTGEGEAGIRGGPSGDLYVMINIKHHDIFKVIGADVHCKLPISFTKAALGGDVEIPVIDGTKVALHIPAGTQNDDKLKLKSKGMSKIRSSARGDMYAHITVEVPKNLTKKQKELVEALDKEIGEDGKSGNFFNKMKNLWS